MRVKLNPDSIRRAVMDDAYRDTPRYVAIDARDGKEIWAEGFAKLETAMLWLLDKELSAEDLRGAETVLLKSTLSKNFLGDVLT